VNHGRNIFSERGKIFGAAEQTFTHNRALDEWGSERSLDE
jgi:hypothetical protein